MDNRPIGVFDSGLGGLTVVKSLCSLLPNENIVYFGDTGRVPYGTRSRETIETYAKQDAAFLLSKDVKLIIAACGTVSSVAPDTGKNLPVPYFGVVEPAAKAAAKHTKTGRIGVIGTTATIRSGAYEQALLKINKRFLIRSVDCPLFVPIVEAGWIDDDEVAMLTAKRYLKTIKDFEVDTLILGCTHYPLLSKTIAQIMGPQVTLISAGAAAAAHCVEVLKENALLCAKENNGTHSFYVTDRPDGFSKTAEIFLQQDFTGDVTRVQVD